MGVGICRFSEEEGCYETTNAIFRVFLSKENIILNAPGLWKHYMMKHSVQPTEEEREVVMNAQLENAKIPFWPNGAPQEITERKILYVEKTENGYSHETGNEIDTEFQGKLETLLKKGETMYTKGL